MRTVTALILVFIAFIGFQILPFTLVSVNGNSMQPTIPNGAIQLVHESNTADTGDIIVFQSQQNEQRQIIHRVVKEKPNGFVTKGDNNNITDQKAGELLVTSENIIGRAVTINNQPIYIPYLGTIYRFIQINPIESFILGLGGLGVYILYKELIISKKQLGTMTYNDIILPIFITVFLGLAIIILISSSTLTVTMTYTTSDIVSQQQYVVMVGEENPQELITFKSSESLGKETYVSSYNIIKIVDSKGEDRKILIELPTRNSPGVESGYIKVYRFPPVLPHSWLQSLTTVTPLIPAVVSSGVFVFPLYILFLIFGEPYQRVTKPRNRLLRRLYEWVG